MVLLVLLLFAPAFAASGEGLERPTESPVLVDRAAIDLILPEWQAPLVWTLAAVGTGTAVLLAVKAVETAPAPSSFIALAWGTLAMAFVAAAFDFLLMEPTPVPN